MSRERGQGVDEQTQRVVNQLAGLRAQRVRNPARATLADRRAFVKDPRSLARHLKLRADDTLGTHMELASDTAARLRKAMRDVAVAWRETVEISVRHPAVLVELRRGVLLVIVEHQAAKFALDRVLRAGAKSHFIRSCKASVSDVRVAVGKPPEPIVASRRRTRTLEEEQQEVQDYLDAGLISERQVSELIEAWGVALRRARMRDGGEVSESSTQK